MNRSKWGIDNELAALPATGQKVTPMGDLNQDFALVASKLADDWQQLHTLYIS
jgi:hypothetical protein